MKVCAEFEDQFTAMEAHRHLLAAGVDPNDIEVRSPYPLFERPMHNLPHRSNPMNMRTVVRCMWAIAVCLGFSFVSFTQYEWAPVSVTNGHPLIPPPITMLVTYECGMFTAIWTTTFMFFLETYRHRQLVPPLEEDMPVAIGYVVIVVAGRSAETALKLLEGRGARSVVSYGLAFLMAFMLTGCARFNMREQDALKPTEVRSNYPGAQSMRMPSELDQQHAPPLGYMNAGDVQLADRIQALTVKKQQLGRDITAAGTDKAAVDRLTTEQTNVQKLLDEANKQMKASGSEPRMWTLKKLNGPPPKIQGWSNPIKADERSLARGEHLYQINCAMCHGATGKGEGKVGEVEYVKPPEIGDATYGGKLSDGYLYYFIFTGKNLMPSFGYRLTNDEICDIINHLRKLQGKV